MRPQLMRRGKSVIVLATTLTLQSLIVSAAGASPAPTSIGQDAASSSRSQTIEQVQWRRGPGYGYGRGWGPGALIGGVIIGGVLTAAAIAEHRAEPSAMRACARDFRSFDPRSGTFVNNDGDVRVCPYLK
jgi:BA14K-like protein